MKKTISKILVAMAAAAMLLTPCKSDAQYKSGEFESAILKGTRTNTGKPGAKYSNNFAEYKITASFDPDTQILEGEETVTYHYNMPGRGLGTIVFNLYRNIYKKGAMRQRDCNAEDITDEGMEILSITKDGTSLHYTIDGTKLTASLPGYLTQGGKATLVVKWRNKIAATTHHRGGKYYSNSWFIPYWYPQIAVCDDLYGWDEIQHSGNEEFLLEFANYDVTLKLGGKMMAWATGELVDPKSVFTNDFVLKYNKAKASNEVVTLFAPGKSSAVLKNAVNEWHFKADSVPDFVFACSNEMGWGATSTPIRKGKPRTFVSAVYKDDGFKNSVVNTTRKTLEYLSTERPGVPYPYAHMTVFEGSGGMEFPMMINEDFDNNYDSDFFTTSHEVTHSYFPFITGMYQNRFAFMDEGLTQYVPQYFQNENFKSKDIIHDAYRYTGYVMGSDDNVPTGTPSYAQTDLWIYTVNSYYKPQTMYTVLEDVVGKETMTKILREFVLTWRGKHPHPMDFYNLCSTISGKDLKEFFRSWMYSADYSDLAMASIDGNKVTIRNIGGLMVPVELVVSYEDGTVGKEHRDALVWSGGKREITIEMPKKIKTAVVGDAYFPDMDESNNSN
ncbi:MAG: hypothetical protein IJ894_17190 [Bacteroidales bacterium]|nr:hypothetical protein [Bacteroidales bacterium]